MTEQQKELERLGSRIKSSSVKSWIDNVIVPSLVDEWLAHEKSAKCLEDTEVAVAQCERSTVLSAEEAA